ncbi:MAG TPA: hypothetical protein H9827_08830 [Candidatus Luteimonas excrementigallinarum]|nr:hypothetical protein [Candidatus Luteimonas excrementigallinarum]
MTSSFSRATTRQGLIALALATVAGTACTHAPASAGYDQTQQATETAAMADAGASTTVEGQGVRVEASFEAPAGGPLTVRYQVHNSGDADLAVFDRGNRHAVMTKRLQAGDVGEPVFHEADGGLTLSHRALPLPEPSPTLPPVPLAARLAPGASLEGTFNFAPLVGGQPDRVRWCLGVAPFDDELFRSPEQGGAVEVWQAAFSLADSQQLVCTPWFDTARGAFED